MRSCHEKSVPFLLHPPPLSDRNLYPAALLCMRGNHFRPYLSIFVCAIEVQHNNENPTTKHPVILASITRSTILVFLITLTCSENCFRLLCIQDRIPFAVVGSNTVLEVNGKRVRARVYPWGVAEGKRVLTST